MGFHYRWFDRDQEKIDEMGIPLSRAEIDAREHAKQPERLFSRGEQTGIVLSSVIFAYGWIEGDLSLSFFCLSFSNQLLCFGKILSGEFSLNIHEAFYQRLILLIHLVVALRYRTRNNQWRTSIINKH